MPYHSFSLGNFTAYTPVWSSTGTQPALGNGTITGKYLIESDVVIAFVELTMGSTTTYGTGTYLLSLPVAYASMIGSLPQTGFDSSASENSLLCALQNTITTVAAVGVRVSGANAPWAFVGTTAPITWAQSDILRLGIMYEPL